MSILEKTFPGKFRDLFGVTRLAMTMEMERALPS